MSARDEAGRLASLDVKVTDKGTGELSQGVKEPITEHSLRRIFQAQEYFMPKLTVLKQGSTENRKRAQVTGVQ